MNSTNSVFYLSVSFPFPVGLCSPWNFSCTCQQVFYNSFSSCFVFKFSAFFPHGDEGFSLDSLMLFGPCLSYFSFNCCLDPLASCLFSSRSNLPVQATWENVENLFLFPLPGSRLFEHHLPTLDGKVFSVYDADGEDPPVTLGTQFCFMWSSSFVGTLGFQGREELKSAWVSTLLILQMRHSPRDQ